MNQILLHLLLRLVATAAITHAPGIYFHAEQLPDSVYQAMQGVSIHSGCPVEKNHLRHVSVLHYTPDGRVRPGHLVVHRDVCDDILHVFRRLYRLHYPITSIEPIDAYGGDDLASMAANNTSAFCHRNVAGTASLSLHSYGRAVDINPLYNPLVRSRGGVTTVLPPEGRAYADRTRQFPMKITADDPAVRLFKSRGWRWGGDFRSSCDPQHFEKP